jgi:hypothetical protein
MQSSPTRAVPAQVSPTPTKLLQPTPKILTATKQDTLATPSAKSQTTAAIPPIAESRNNSAGSNKNLISIGIVVAVLILVVTLWLIFIRKRTL